MNTILLFLIAVPAIEIYVMIKIGQNIYGFYQSTFKEKKISKNGDAYIDLLLILVI